MSRKTARDIASERTANELNKTLPGSLRVVGGGRRGPYTLTIDGLTRKHLDRVVRAACEVLGLSQPEHRACKKPPPA